MNYLGTLQLGHINVVRVYNVYSNKIEHDEHDETKNSKMWKGKYPECSW